MKKHPLSEAYDFESTGLRLASVADKIFANVIRSTPEYASNFNTLIDKRFKKSDFNLRISEKDSRPIFRELQELNIGSSSSLTTNFNEQFSDECYTVLLEKNSEQKYKCQTNDQCISYYTQADASGTATARNF